jgi:FkbM family methyltransferase
MAVRASTDLVSQTIADTGFWEVEDPRLWGEPGQALDIGGNVGYYTFSLANAGWNVTTFEPMDRNIALIQATLCQNPDLAKRVKLLTFGLGAENQLCVMNVAKDNLGNGVMRCSEADVNDAEWERLNFVQAGSFQIRRLQEVLQEEHILKVDFIKIDVEGYECEVFKGAGGAWFLTSYKPRLVKSEVWKDMQRCNSLEYFAMFEDTGYKIGMDADPACQQKEWKENPEWANTTKFWAAGANFYMCRDT